MTITKTPDIRPMVAVINSSPDTVSMLQTVLEHAGMRTVSAYTFDIRDGRTDAAELIRQHEPTVIVYDIAPPYDANVQLFRTVQATAAFRGKQFVITSTNAPYVQELIGRDEQVYEVIGKPADLYRIVQATKEAVRNRPTR